MLLLAVDTADQAGSVAVLKDGQVAGVISTASSEAYSARLLRQVDFLLSELKIEVRDFDVFAVNAGPGSFTGLRVGLAAVKALAEVFAKPLVGVSGLEAVAAQARPLLDGALVAPVLDAHRSQIYAALFRFRDTRLYIEEPEQVCEAQEFLTRLESRNGDESVGFISPCPEVLRPALDRWTDAPKGISRTIEPASAVLAPMIAQLAGIRAANGEFTDSLRLDANYVRRSDAELLWKEP
jgi:tRNA threonylcarbamoyladenosine biosynthesis protein TsaB